MPIPTMRSAPHWAFPGSPASQHSPFYSLLSNLTYVLNILAKASPSEKGLSVPPSFTKFYLWSSIYFFRAPVPHTAHIILLIYSLYGTPMSQQLYSHLKTCSSTSQGKGIILFNGKLLGDRKENCLVFKTTPKIGKAVFSNMKDYQKTKESKHWRWAG